MQGRLHHRSRVAPLQGSRQRVPLPVRSGAKTAKEPGGVEGGDSQMSEKKSRRLFKPGDYQMRVLSAGWRRADNGTVFLQVIGAVYAYIKPSKRGELVIAEDFQ